MRNLCTDPLENFFGAVCQSGGLNDKPDCLQFLNKSQKFFKDVEDIIA